MPKESKRNGRPWCISFLSFNGTTTRQIKDLHYDVDDARSLFSKYQDIYYDFLPEDFGMDLFIGDPKAKRTDLLSTNFFGTNGFFISRKFQDFHRVIKFVIINTCPFLLKI